MPRTNMMEHRTERLDDGLDDARQASYPGSRTDDWRESDFKSSLDGRAGETLDHLIDPLAEHDSHGHRQLAYSLAHNMERLTFPTGAARWETSRELAEKLFEPARERLEIEDAALEPVLREMFGRAQLENDGMINRAEGLERYQGRMAEITYQPDMPPGLKARELERVLHEAQVYMEDGEIEPKSRLTHGYEAVRGMENEALRDMAAESDVRANWTPVDNAVNGLHYRGDTDAYTASLAAQEVFRTHADIASEAVEQDDQWSYETVMDRADWKGEKLAHAIQHGTGAAGGEGYSQPEVPGREDGIEGAIAYIIQVESRLDNPRLEFDEPDTLRRLTGDYRQLLEHIAYEQEAGASQDGAGQDHRPDAGRDSWEARDSLEQQTQVIAYLMRPKAN